jgi:hypothetical protein
MEMNKDDIIRMADEAMYLNLPIANRNFELQELIKFAELVAAAEREACAKIIEESYATTKPNEGIPEDWLLVLADVIRARGQK